MQTSEPTAEAVARLLIQVYTIHEVVIEETGGLAGMRDVLMVHAAVARPFASFAEEALYRDDFTQAAALFHSLIKSHPFLDGTKRTAFLSALYFLAERGYRIPDQLPQKEVVRFCVALAEENMRQARGENIEIKTIDAIADWFRQLLQGEHG